MKICYIKIKRKVGTILKKYGAISLLIIAMLALAACGNTDKTEKNTDKEKTAKTEESQKTKEKTKEKIQKKATEKKEENTSEKATEKKESANKSSNQQASKKENSTNKQTSKKEKTTKKNTPTNKSSNTTQKAKFSLSSNGFKVSNVEPILGGNVSNVYLDNKASFIKIFRNLTIKINQTKVEKILSPTKKVAASDPESYLNGKDGYVVTLDVSIQNRSSKDVIYKANQISLMNGSKSVGGSLDNFVPSSYMLSGSSKDPFVFAPHKTARGLITYTMDAATYNSIKNNTKIGVINPDSFDTTVKDKDEDIVVPYTIK